MGARFVLHLALANPELVRRLVVIGGTGGIDDATARAERAKNDEAMAQQLERDGLEHFLDAWLAQPLFAGLSEEMQFREARKQNTVMGLAESLRQAGTGVQDPLWGRLHRLEMPVLVVAGAADEKFSAEGQRLVESIGPNATLSLLEGAGHAAHLEQPELFLSTLRAWFNR
jgi:2-succinyl-6-hydroxy-2,4-cyclohexadiene-1-carboxylate synthase